MDTTGVVYAFLTLICGSASGALPAESALCVSWRHLSSQSANASCPGKSLHPLLGLPSGALAQMATRTGLEDVFSCSPLYYIRWQWCRRVHGKRCEETRQAACQMRHGSRFEIILD
jgi:hypothetical protein